ncbi:HIT family protein [Campylobacter geochelonis]|uniref:HIT family protein n=1 Tax=Campylobacter geochelonis TaxID=1780362 RepID=UPI0007707417|nr:HIT family protein [Campylobacter geochelonis]CZE47757.1 HIT family protein [Campylobacter geochelonis]CZE50889.1 HIT family protein [Campylobacter geochelonis]
MIYQNKFIFIERETSEIPWVKIFSKKEFKELSDCDEATRQALFDSMMITEKAMISFYNPDKINIASFANYVPRVHIHVMARFKEDSFFPESMWGVKQREAKLNLADFSEFEKILVSNLKAKFE